MKIDVATADDIFDVALRMRPTDFAEFDALYPTSGRQQLAHAIAMRYGSRQDIIVASHGEHRTAIGAPIETRPNVLTLLFFATPDFNSIALPLTRFITRRLFPPLVNAGAHRIEAVSMDGHDEAHRWIELLGLKRETVPMLGYGKNGESFIQFAWVADVSAPRT